MQMFGEENRGYLRNDKNNLKDSATDHENS